MINKVILVGNVGKDPEVKQISSGQVAKFSLATSETWKKDGEKQTKTEWHNIVAFGPIVDVIEKYVKKGDKLYIEGKIKTNKHEDKYYTSIVCQNMTMLGGVNNEKKQETEIGDTDSSETDDLPF